MERSCLGTLNTSLFSNSSISILQKHVIEIQRIARFEDTRTEFLVAPFCCLEVKAPPPPNLLCVSSIVLIDVIQLYSFLKSSSWELG
jgi:hypothetical protein